MRIVTTTSVFPPEAPACATLERLASIGYKALDLALDYCSDPGHPFMGAYWREWAEDLRRRADELGVQYTHAHAEGYPTERGIAMLRSFEVCRILGISYLVVHPIFSMDGKNIEDDEEFIRVNADAYRGLLPYAEEAGVTILTENLLRGSSIAPRAIAKLVSAVAHPNFGWCFDTGHVNYRGDGIESLREAEVVPLSLHIQDNHGPGSGDEHLLPGDGVIDWKLFLDLLVEVGYRGDLVLEAHHQSLEASDGERDAILADLLGRAEKMRAYLESK